MSPRSNPNAAESKELSRWLKRPSQCRADSARAVDLPRRLGDARAGAGDDADLHEDYGRRLLRQYNEEGLAALRTRAHPGRPPALTPEDESVVVEIATMPPRAFGQPFNQWSLRKLTDHLVGRQMIPQGLVRDDRQGPGRHKGHLPADSHLEGVEGSGLRPRPDLTLIGRPVS